MTTGTAAHRRRASAARDVDSSADGERTKPVEIVIMHHLSLFDDVIALRLAAVEDFSLMATVTEHDRGVATVRMLKPDVVVTDATDNADTVNDLTRALCALLPAPRVVVIGASDDPQLVCESLRAGAHAWVPWESAVDALVHAIRGAMRDEIYVPHALVTPVIRELLRTPQGPSDAERRVDSLSDRERQVLELMVSGLHRDAIARQLGVSLHTVRTHTQSCFAKMGVHSSLEAIHVAFRAGIRPQLTVVPSSDGEPNVQRMADARLSQRGDAGSSKERHR